MNYLALFFVFFIKRMAKRTSKKAHAAEVLKEEPTIDKDILNETKSAEAGKEKAGKPHSNSKKPNPAKSKKKIAVVDLADMVQSRIPSRKTARGTTVKMEKGETKRKPVPKVALSGKGKAKKRNPPTIRKASTIAAVKPALRSVYSNSKLTLLVLGFGSDFNTKKSVVIFSDLITGQVHTIALSVWNRWKLREVKKINTET